MMVWTARSNGDSDAGARACGQQYLEACVPAARAILSDSDSNANTWAFNEQYMVFCVSAVGTVWTEDGSA